ncbi:activating transcription factor 7-interacting protein 1-like [Periophthalmus magnuspinnatus]|uniref:activating transcription factor 7-interacting protein 1-like n=1 Tax=Periophthalmus magnuspinnatus TaxID=409849 RepID=UPI002436CB1E|nr:activating transcription factor 7-interacting protein 1-like [Periophthalmus magnuspinnatus]
MKDVLSVTSAPASSGQNITISKRELEMLIEQEVGSVMKKKENSLDALIENIQQQLDQWRNHEVSIKTLQTHMMTVSNRAEEALAYIAKNPTPPAADTNGDQSHLGSTDTESQHVSSVSKLMERTKKEFERLHAENTAFKAALEDVQQRQTSSPKTTIRQSKGVIKGLAKFLHNKKGDSPTPVPVKRTTDELRSPEVDSNSKRIKSEPKEVPYPPLPVLPFPSSLPPEAATYSIPPRLKVELALIKNPTPQLSVVWSLEEDEPNVPPMDTYSIYLTTEVSIGSNQFDGWQQLGAYAAAPLPMFCLYTKYKPGYKICVSVVGKDKFGRYGPYSEVTCAYI